MKEKIIAKASEMFLKLGFKSVTMDDIAGEMCISKKTIYKYFCNKELLIEQGTTMVHAQIHASINDIIKKNHNSIAENFEVRTMFNNMFIAAESSPLYQLKKHYPDIYRTVVHREIDECKRCFTQNIEKGMAQGFYRNNIDVAASVLFYYSLIFSINENTPTERETQILELKALEYHTRAIATPKGIAELEHHLETISKQL